MQARPPGHVRKSRPSHSATVSVLAFAITKQIPPILIRSTRPFQDQLVFILGCWWGRDDGPDLICLWLCLPASLAPMHCSIPSPILSFFCSSKKKKTYPLFFSAKTPHLLFSTVQVWLYKRGNFRAPKHSLCPEEANRPRPRPVYLLFKMRIYRACVRIDGDLRVLDLWVGLLDTPAFVPHRSQIHRSWQHIRPWA